MAEKMHSCQAPVKAVQTQVLSKPVFQLVFALQSGQRRGFLVGVGGQLVSTHGVKALNIADMFINKEAQFLWQAGVCDAAAARARNKRHEVGGYWGDTGWRGTSRSA